MMNSFFFSVVIPTYNRELLIVRAVDSVLAQQFTDFEVWVVDDGSTDNTEKIIRSIKDSRLQYIKIKNSERGAARNTGIKLSRGRYVTFLDSDDYFYPSHLAFVYKQLAQKNHPEFYHQGYVVMNARERILQKSYPIGDLGKALFARGNLMSCAGVFVSRIILLENLFNESRILAGLEDWELWIRLVSIFPLHYDPTVTSVLVQHDDRSSMQVQRNKLENKGRLFIELVSSNPHVKATYGPLIPKLVANVYSYLSLHLSDTHGEKAVARQFLFRAIKKDRGQIFKKRTLVILRNLLFT